MTDAALTAGLIALAMALIEVIKSQVSKPPKTNGTTKADLYWQAAKTSHSNQEELLKELVTLNRTILLNVSQCPRQEPHHGQAH